MVLPHSRGPLLGVLNTLPSGQSSRRPRDVCCEEGGGRLQLGVEPEADANPIKSVKMVPLASLQEYGFSERFCELALAGFPGSGSYRAR